MPNELPYYTVKELAALSNRAEITIRRHLRKGAIEAKKVGGEVRIPRHVGDKYCEGEKYQPEN